MFGEGFGAAGLVDVGFRGEPCYCCFGDVLLKASNHFISMDVFFERGRMLYTLTVR